MQLFVIDESQMAACVDAEIRDALCRCFPADAAAFRATRAWHGSMAAFSILLRDGNRLVGHAGVVDRTIRAGSRPLRAAGVQNVLVLPECRGHGYSSLILDAAMAEALRREFDVGVLFCRPALELIYVRCGWQALGYRDLLVGSGAEESPAPAGNVSMFYPLDVSVFPDGPIHLCGNDW